MVSPKAPFCVLLEGYWLTCTQVKFYLFIYLPIYYFIIYLISNTLPLSTQHGKALIQAYYQEPAQPSFKQSSCVRLCTSPWVM